MQPDKQDLKKEWKERCARKQPYFDRALMKNSLINFSEYTKSTTRHEMPNKYNIPHVPKIEIERVYHLNLLRKSKSISGAIPSAPTTPIEAPTSSQKPFYYSSNNEILSLEEFLQVHKAVKGYQKKQDKIIFNRTMMEKRMKIEEVYTERGLSSQTARRPSDPFLSAVGRPISTQMSRKISASQLTRPTTARNPMENILLDQTNLSSKTPKTAGNITDRALKLKKGLSLKTNLDINLAGIEDTISTLRETTRIQPNSARGFTTNQKFTEKEIAKHLMRGTVSPKPPKYGGKGVEKEKAYNRMFRDAKTMDLAVEASIKKATRIINNEGQKSSRLKEKSPEVENIEPEDDLKVQLNNKYGIKPIEIPISPFEAVEKGEGDQLVTDMIQTSLKNINAALLTTTPRLLVGIFGGTDEPKTEKKKVRTKTLLRSEIEQKYDFSKHLEQNRVLSSKIRTVTRALKKEVPLSSMSNQNYVEFFN